MMLWVIFMKTNLLFSILLLIIYILTNTLLSNASLFLNSILLIIMVLYINRNHLNEYYGLCLSKIENRKFLYYLPLLMLIGVNLINGIRYDVSFLAIINIVVISINEEMIFRGFIFKAVDKNVAIIISLSSYIICHLIIYDYSNIYLEILSSLILGYMYLLLIDKSGSLLPSIVTHSLMSITLLLRIDGTIINDLMLLIISFLIAVDYCLFMIHTIKKPSL